MIQRPTPAMPEGQPFFFPFPERESRRVKENVSVDKEEAKRGYGKWVVEERGGSVYSVGLWMQKIWTFFFFSFR